MVARRRVRALALAASAGALLVPVAAQARDLHVLPRTSAAVTLRPRDPRALAAYAASVSTAGSPDYHHYLSVAEFTRRFAPTVTQRRAVITQLRARGLTVEAASPDGLSITVSGSTRADGDALTDDATGAPRLTGPASRYVQGVVALSGAAPTASIIVERNRSALTPDALSHVATTPSAGPQACAAAQAQATTQGSLTAAQIAARYGLSNFYAAGDEGRGVTVGLYELEPFSASDIAGYQACMGTSATVQTEAVDGGAGVGSGSGEAATDIEDIIGLVPDATIRVYEGPQNGSGAYQTYAAMVADDAAQVISTSWGLCESRLGSAAAQAENTLFQEAAAQGQTVLAASGDSGADDCDNGARAVDDPASQPYVTGVGGTSARGLVDTVWDDSLGAGGGGASSLWARPAWQTSALAQTAVTCGTAGSSCREVPDVSADADPSTGYVAYYKGAWRTVGGTSAAAPTVAALVALADAAPSCAGHPVGFLDPALYAHAADFIDVSSGSNTFGGVLGFSAGAGYDMASGLGTPSAALGPALCGDALSLAAPAAQSWTTGHPVSLTPSATSTKGAAVTWSATGLPAGLSIAASGGRITGTPTAALRTTVTLMALDADGASASTSFPVTITAQAVSVSPPATPSAGASGSTAPASGSTSVVQQLRPISARVGRTVWVRLRVRLSSAGTLAWSASGLPRGLRIGRRTGLITGTPRAVGHRTVRIDVSSSSGAAAAARMGVRVTGRVSPASTAADRRRDRQRARSRRR
jgi:subtilase family serine protease